MQTFESNQPAGIRRGGGFTLVELLVSVSLMVVIVFALYSMFNQTQKALRGNMTQVDVSAAGRAAMELMGRELAQMQACSLDGATNFYAGMIPVAPVVQTDESGKFAVKTNVLQEFYFLSRVTNNWVGTGYLVRGADSGVGTLYRFSIATNRLGLTYRNLSEAFFASGVTGAGGTLSTNLASVADGIIALRLVAFDPSGLPLGFDTTNIHSTYQIARYDASGNKLASSSGGSQPPNVLLRQDLDKVTTRSVFLSNAVPAYVELELGILEPDALDKYNALRNGPPQLARDFLKKQADKVHIFRQQIPIRTAAQ